MNARNRVFILLGLMAAASLVWYFMTRHESADLMLIGTVDANEVLVSAKIPGRIQTLTVEEGQEVKAGQLIAVIESQDLDAAHRAALANATSQQSKLEETVDTVRQTRGETDSQLVAAEANLRVAHASEAQAQAQLEHQQADTKRIVALTEQGVASAQSRDDAVTSLHAAEAALEAAKEQVSSADATLRQMRAHTIQTAVAERTVASTRGIVANAQALADQAEVELGYSQVISPVGGRVNVRAARQGEVVGMGATIVTVMDLTQTWVYAPLPETQAEAVHLGDSLRVEMPSGNSVQGTVISKAAEADFATQRDINGGRKRDIRTVQIKLQIDNPGEAFVPGMTARVFIPRDKLVKK
jgi:multidrug resistance efflux pump